jgi:hypothetical protein
VLNVNTGDWVRRDSGVGAGIDSYYEYVAKVESPHIVHLLCKLVKMQIKLSFLQGLRASGRGEVLGEMEHPLLSRHEVFRYINFCYKILWIFLQGTGILLLIFWESTIV